MTTTAEPVAATDWRDRGYAFPGTEYDRCDGACDRAPALDSPHWHRKPFDEADPQVNRPRELSRG